MTFIRDGESIRFVADDRTLDPVQRAVAQQSGQSQSTMQPQSRPANTDPVRSVLDKECYRTYDQKLESAYLDAAQPVIVGKEGAQT